MNGRPCNPGSDLRQLWQALLGDTPFPQCGTADAAASAQEGSAVWDTKKPPPEPDRASTARRDR